MQLADIELRDYFAIHAPQPSRETISLYLSLDKGRNPHKDHFKPKIRTEVEIECDLRYEFADMMMKTSVKVLDK